MAPREIGGVLDSKLFVYGTRNLRVADAGSMPINIAAHTVATVFAMGEKVRGLLILVEVTSTDFFFVRPRILSSQIVVSTMLIKPTFTSDGVVFSNSCDKVMERVRPPLWVGDGGMAFKNNGLDSTNNTYFNECQLSLLDQ
jgi:hypothetical protein